jgi:hypothetical protein
MYKIKKNIKRITEILFQTMLRILFLINDKAINMGKITKAYL